MQFDEFYQTVGVFGRYQKVKYFLVCLTYMLPPILVYTWTFTAATPSFRCRTSMDDITDSLVRYYVPSESQCRTYKSALSLQECQRCFQTTNRSLYEKEYSDILKPCTSFTFNRTYHQSTLVEEVRLFFREERVNYSSLFSSIMF